MKKITLTERQTEVLKYIAAGYSDEDMAKELKCTVANIRSLSDRLIYKIKANNRPNLIYKAFKKGLLK